MARYIALLKFTEQGSKNIKASTTRAKAFAKLASKAGVTVEGQYWTTGSHDGAMVLAGKKEEDILHLLTELASLGNVRTESLRAFSAKEFDDIIEG